MALIAKLNIEKATARQLLRVVVKATDEINEASFTHGQNKRRYKVDIMAQGSEFYVPNIFRDCIAVTAKGYPDISTWSDLELVNTKSGWGSLCIVSSSLLSGVKYDHMGNPCPIKQTMAVLTSFKNGTMHLPDFRLPLFSMLNTRLVKYSISILRS
jgi:hypothetical protein